MYTHAPQVLYLLSNYDQTLINFLLQPSIKPYVLRHQWYTQVWANLMRPDPYAGGCGHDENGDGPAGHGLFLMAHPIRLALH
jgi:hypothetical protein